MKVLYSKATWDMFRQPCTYKFLGADSAVLYIGSSEFGFSRVFLRHGGSHKNRHIAMTTSEAVEVEFFDTVEQAYEKECQELHKYHPAGQNCPICSQDSVIGHVNPETLSRHLATAEAFIKEYTKIPSDTWLVKNGHASFATYARLHSKLFQEYPKIKFRQGRPRMKTC